MKPIYSIYPDFYCMSGGCWLIDCDHALLFDGSQSSVYFESDDLICETCWVRYQNPTHVASLGGDHQPTGPGEWPWH